MRILADQNIPFVEQAFSRFGEVTTFIGRELTAQAVRAADILLVRSVTRVNAQLLADANVRFVASATIGTDHVDLDYLQQRKIAFANAPGSNADSAAQYVLAALLYFAQRTHVDLSTLRYGIVGYGNVGSRVAAILRILGLQYEVYDPPRQHLHADIRYSNWQDICDCDVVTAHVPLTRSGEYPTYHMFDQHFFTALKPAALFINTARGAAVDERALHARLNTNRPLHLLLDVWENEPRIDAALLTATLLGTPHIAGYAYEGKLRGTEMIYQAACRHFGVAPQWSMQTVLQDSRDLITPVPQHNWQASLHQIVRHAYDIASDDAALRRTLTMNREQAAAQFDAMRKHYPVRHEFSRYKVAGVQLSAQQRNVITQLGFGVI